VADGALNGHVRQFFSRAGAPQQQSAAAHVAAADEIDRELEPLAEHLRQHVDVLGRGNAAEQDDLAVGADLLVERAGACEQRTAIPRIVGGDVHTGKGADRGVRHRGLDGTQSGVRRDDQRSASSELRGGIRRPRERQRVGELALEVETADEGEYFADGDALFAAQADGEVERRLLGEHDLRARPGAVRRREQEDAGRRQRFRTTSLHHLDRAYQTFMSVTVTRDRVRNP
jgi:hypothetical protein